MIVLKAHQQEHVPATPLVVAYVIARTVLAGKGPLRRAKSGRALACSAPFRPKRLRDERLRREHLTAYMPHPNLQNLTYTTRKNPRGRAESFLFTKTHTFSSAEPKHV